MMKNINYTYEAKPIDTAMLNVLDVTSDGKIVSAADWTALWGVVLGRINHIDAYCSDISALAINWQESTAAFEKAVTDINALFNTLSDGFIHYGDEAPTDEHIRLWVQKSSVVDAKILVNKAELTAAIINSETAINAITDQKLEVKADKLERITQLTITPELPEGVTQFIADSKINSIAYPTVDKVTHESYAMVLFDRVIPKDSVITVYHRMLRSSGPNRPRTHTFYLKTNTHWSGKSGNDVQYGYYIFIIRVEDGVVVEGTHQFIEDNTEFPNTSNTIKMWQSDTVYKKGDCCFAPCNVDDYVVYALCTCTEKHSSNYTNSPHSVTQNVWTLQYISANQSYKDAVGSVIHETYATKEELAEAIGLALEGDY